MIININILKRLEKADLSFFNELLIEKYKNQFDLKLELSREKIKFLQIEITGLQLRIRDLEKNDVIFLKPILTNDFFIYTLLNFKRRNHIKNDIHGMK